MVVVVCMLRLYAGVDRNGNTRRGYVALGREGVVGAWRVAEARSLPDGLYDLGNQAILVTVKPAEFRDFMRVGTEALENHAKANGGKNLIRAARIFILGATID